MQPLEDLMLLHEKQRQEALNFFRGFRFVLLSIFVFPRRPADVGTENIQDGLTQVFGVLCKMEEFVSAAQTHGVGLMPQVFNGIFQTFLSLPTLDVLISRCLLFRGLGLRVRRVFHRLGTCMRSQGLQGEQDAAHADSQEFQRLRFFLYP